MAIVLDASIAASWCFPDEKARLQSECSTTYRGLAA